MGAGYGGNGRSILGSNSSWSVRCNAQSCQKASRNSNQPSCCGWRARPSKGGRLAATGSAALRHPLPGALSGADRCDAMLCSRCRDWGAGGFRRQSQPAVQQDETLAALTSQIGCPGNRLGLSLFPRTPAALSRNLCRAQTWPRCWRPLAALGHSQALAAPMGLRGSKGWPAGAHPPWL